MRIGIRVSCMKSVRGTQAPASVPAALGIGGGTSPGGKMMPEPRSKATPARTWRRLMAVSQSGPPPWEWVTRMPGPTLVTRGSGRGFTGIWQDT